jgi:putative hemolysin
VFTKSDSLFSIKEGTKMKFLIKFKSFWFLTMILSLTSVLGFAKLTTKNNIQLGNPASSFCVKKDGVLQLYSSQKGEVGICWFEQGGVEEWTLYQYLRGSHQKLKAIELLLSHSHEKKSLDEDSAKKYCGLHGGQIEILSSKERPDSSITLCRLNDRSALESWTLYYGVSHFKGLKKLLLEE